MWEWSLYTYQLGHYMRLFCPQLQVSHIQQGLVAKITAKGNAVKEPWEDTSARHRCWKLLCVYECVCAHACVSVCARACVCPCVCVLAHVYVCIFRRAMTYSLPLSQALKLNRPTVSYLLLRNTWLVWQHGSYLSSFKVDIQPLIFPVSLITLMVVDFY